MNSTLLKTRSNLPAYPFRDELIEAVTQNRTLVVVGETGSGKTTQIPQFLFEAFKESVELQEETSLEKTPKFSNICVTQPRRIAAITVSKRVCQEAGVQLGKEIGYTIRFEDCCSSLTRLRYVTDGILLRELCSDPLLTQYDCVIIDEAHERTLDTDIIIGLVKMAQRKRLVKPTQFSPLHIIVMSATLNVEKFSDFFDGCPIFTIPGRVFDVTIHHHPQTSLDKLRTIYVDRAVETALEVHLESEPGDMLVFLTGQLEINRAISQFHNKLDLIFKERENSGLDLPIFVTAVPIYAGLEQFDQRLAFEPPPPGYRKIVFATNIAQTSITIPGIVYVVDCGFVKQKTFEPKTGMDGLLVVPISQAAAIQRAGRAGRTQNGTVFRLYSRAGFESMEPETTPEIQRSSLLGSVLTMKAIGITDVPGFAFLDPPTQTHIQTAIKKLSLLGAIVEDEITSLGSQMARLPLPPYLSCILIHSALPEFACSKQILVIAAMLSVEDPIKQPRSDHSQSIQRKWFNKLFSDHTGDHLTLYNIFMEANRHHFDRDWCDDHFLHHKHLKRASEVHNQLKSLMENLSLKIISLPTKNSYGKPSQRFDSAPVLKVLCQGYFLNLARRHPQGHAFYHYHASSQDFNNLDHGGLLALNLHPTSILNPRFHLSLLKSHMQSDWVIYSQLLYTAQCQIRHVSVVEPNWAIPLIKKSAAAIPLPTAAPPKVISAERQCQLDAARQRFLDRQKRSRLR